MSGKTKKDSDDVFAENVNSALVLALGILALAASVALIMTSVMATIRGEALSTSLLGTGIFAAVFFAVGLGSVQLFRKHRERRKKATQPF